MVAGHLQEQNGMYYMVLSYRDENGKRQQPWKSTGLEVKGNKRKAEKMLDEYRSTFVPLIVVSKDNGTMSSDMLFSDFMLLWLEIIKSLVAQTTFSSYTMMVTKKIVPYFKKLGVTLGGLEARHIQIFYIEELKTVSANTVIHEHANIHKALKYAMKMDLILTNPADKIERPKKDKYLASYYTSEELYKLFETTQDHKLGLMIQNLGSDQQSLLNSIKSSIMGNTYDQRLAVAFEELSELRKETNRLNTRYNNNEEKLIKAGGEEAATLKKRIEELIEEISVARSQLSTIESKNENDDDLTEDNNLHKADLTFQYYEQQIASATRTNAALHRKETVDILIKSIKEKATADLKKEIIRKTNEKLKRVITDDFIEIDNIDRYIKLKGRNGASEGQTLSIAYCFLGTLFEDSELEFPFVIDSPTGKMDFEKRQAVADIIPIVFNQMIAFVQSAEVERFADRFYDNPDSQYITIITSQSGDGIEINNGIEFFDSYQREHKGDEK